MKITKKKILIIICVIVSLIIVYPYVIFKYMSYTGDKYLLSKDVPIIDNKLSEDCLNIYWTALGGKGKREMKAITFYQVIRSFSQPIKEYTNESRGNNLKICSAVAFVCIKRVKKQSKYILQSIGLMTWISKNWEIDEALSTFIHLSYYGQGQYGINQASKHYFNKPSNQLSIKDMAILSALPHAPNVYIKNHKLLLKKSNLILNELGKSIEIKELPNTFVKQSQTTPKNR